MGLLPNLLVESRGTVQTLTGTYRAEHVAELTYDLTSLSGDWPRRQTSVHKVKPRGLDRHSPREFSVSKVRGTVLPALNNLERLLAVSSGAHPDPSTSESPEPTESGSASPTQEQGLEVIAPPSHVERIAKSCARLSRYSGMPVSTSDADGVEALLQPVGRRKRGSSSRPNQQRRNSVNAAAPFLRPDVHEPPNRSSKRVRQCMRNGRSCRPRKHVEKIMPQEIEILPEDPVSVYFEKEAERKTHARSSNTRGSQSLPPTTSGPVLPTSATAAGLGPLGADGREAEGDTAQGKAADAGVSPGHAELAPRDGGDAVDAVDGDFSVEAVSAKQKLPAARREACLALRTFIVDNAEDPQFVKDFTLEKNLTQTVGNDDEVEIVASVWRELDDDNSGRVSIGEFREHCDHRARELKKEASNAQEMQRKPKGVLTEDRLLNMSKLVDKLVKVLLGKKSSFSIEDFLRVIWPCASMGEVEHMKAAIKASISTTLRKQINTPPLLCQSEFDALCAVFRHVDVDGSGSVGIDELVQSGLLSQEQADRYIKEVDHDGNGELSMLEFCEMLCPVGYRAFDGAERVVQNDGTCVIYDKKHKVWRKEELNEATDLRPPSASAGVVQRSDSGPTA
mmetsp:Transcript_1874/g.4091  ORF Transcript_1874/g.4091 Transcript_1874/m.4091 type:complete len:622 (-) Transcript_1874:5-1870(-)